MKKYMAILLALCLTLALAGCQTTPSQAESEDTAQTTETTEATETADSANSAEDTGTDSAEDAASADETEQAGTDAADASGSDAADAGADTSADSAESTEEAQAALTDLLTRIRSEARYGVAGSSLTAANLAAAVLDWGMDTPLTTDQISETAKSWYDALESADQEEFRYQADGVAGAIEQVTAEDGADLLDTAGCTESSYPWNDTAIAAAEAVFAQIPAAE